MTAQRRCMDPSTLEAILMLRFNHDLWDIYLVDRIVNGIGVNDSPLEESEAVEINKDDAGEDMVEEATEE